MAKRGQFYPYRIKFAYPNGVKGTLVISNMPLVGIEARALLGRGADIDIYAVDQITRKHELLYHLTPADLPAESGDES